MFVDTSSRSSSSSRGSIDAKRPVSPTKSNSSHFARHSTSRRSTSHKEEPDVPKGIGFVDISNRARVFRNKLIDEFRLNDVGSGVLLKQSHFSSHDARDRQKFADFLRDNPHGTVSFKIFKRSNDWGKRIENVDKRLIRIKNAGSLPIGVWAHWLHNHSWFSSFIIGLIVVNAIILGAQTGLDEVEDYKVFRYMDKIDTITLVLFSLEIILKWLDNFKAFWKDGWNVFDFVVTISSVVPELVIFLMDTEGDNVQAANLAAIAKNLRIWRTFRTLKMIAKFRSLRIIVRTIVEAFQALGFILVLLALLAYIFAILAINMFAEFTTSTRDDLLFQDKFENIGYAFVSLFQLLTLDQWYTIELEIRKVVPGYITGPFFVVWVWCGAFIFRNVFIGVMVRNFQSIALQLSQIDEKSRQDVELEKQFGELQEQIHHEHLNNPESVELLKNGGEWNRTIQRTVASLKNHQCDTLWPRDTLFDYLQTMEQLQENLVEQRELQLLASYALFDMAEKS